MSGYKVIYQIDDANLSMTFECATVEQAINKFEQTNFARHNGLDERDVVGIERVEVVA
tara:strand:+ start:1531 stop:1704 length:174 start_codon:yes stop_codon:yes gene_type:complete